MNLNMNLGFPININVYKKYLIILKYNNFH